MRARTEHELHESKCLVDLVDLPLNTGMHENLFQIRKPLLLVLEHPGPRRSESGTLSPG